jgi:hypothetical protein|tara:strand:- start:4165 stop:4644 length:480 start_codon:yes stop_codon:yes gene_type:complete
VEQDVKDYINNVLAKKRQEFGGKAVCPFAAPELQTSRLMIVTVGNSNLTDLINEFRNSDYQSALFIIEENIPAEQTKKFQYFVNHLLSQQGLTDYKNICFNPNDDVDIDGYNPRSLAPHFMINIANKKVLSKAHRGLKKTNYYDKLPKKYRKFLNLKDN